MYRINEAIITFSLAIPGGLSFAFDISHCSTSLMPLITTSRRFKSNNKSCFVLNDFIDTSFRIFTLDTK